MSDEAALLAAIREHPIEDTPRLAYADWLDEHEKPERAEFIRTQCALSQISEEEDHRTELEIRERQLLAGHAADWALPRPPFPAFVPSQSEERDGYWSVFRRGFLEGVALRGLSPDHLTPSGEFEQLFAAHPIRELRLRNFLPGSLVALAERPELARIETLDLTYFGREDAAAHEERANEVEAFLRSGRLERLRALNLTLFPTEYGPRARWLRLPVFSRLRKLDTWPRDSERDEFWTALAEGQCPELTDLGVPWGHNRETLGAGLRFARSDACKRLRRLRVSTSEVGPAFPWAEVLANAPLRELQVSAGSGTNAPELLAALTDTPTTNELRRLRMFGINATGAGVAGWLKSGYAVGVRELDIEYARLNDSDLERLAETSELERLTRLSVPGYSAGTPAGLQTLVASPHLTGLRYLDISNTGLSASVILQLAERGTCRGLRVLCAGEPQNWGTSVPTAPTRPAVLSLGKGKPLPHLRTIRTWFSDENQNPADLDELIGSSNLPNLTMLRVGFRESKLADWKQFAAGTRLAWIGGHMSNGNWDVGSVALHPQNVYLPNHLDEPGW
jgi:uncharacterized protein (TIGR02996 family)